MRNNERDGDDKCGVWPACCAGERASRARGLRASDAARVFAAVQLRILEEYERRDRNGRGVLLRREGLYTSSISEWRRQREEGALQALSASPGRPPTDPREP